MVKVHHLRVISSNSLRFQWYAASIRGYCSLPVKVTTATDLPVRCSTDRVAQPVSVAWTQTPRWAKPGESETRIQIAITTPTACSISRITTMSSTMTRTRRKRMCSGRYSSRSAPRRRRRGCTTAARCTRMVLFQEVRELLDQMGTCMQAQVRWHASRHSVRPMTLTSICRSSNEFSASTSSFHSHLTAARSSNCRTLNHSWWSLA